MRESSADRVRCRRWREMVGDQGIAEARDHEQQGQAQRTSQLCRRDAHRYEWRWSVHRRERTVLLRRDDGR